MRRSAILTHKGVTLVEAIVGGAMAVFVLLTAITLYKMNADQISGSFVRALTRMQYQTIIEEISDKVQKASLVLPINSSVTDIGDTAIPKDEIYLFDPTGNIFAGFKRTGTSFFEWKSGAFTTFKVGNKTIQVKDTVNTFTIAPDRKSVVLNLFVFGISGSSGDTVFSNKERFECRN